MSDKKKVTLLTRLAEVINEVTDGHYGMPTVYDKDANHAGDESTIISWDGPFDWTMICGGSSVYAGESGRYSTPVETQIGEVLELIQNEGFYLEPINQTWIAIYEN